MKAGQMRGRRLLSMSDLNKKEICAVLDYAAFLKMKQQKGEPHQLLAGKTLALIFHKFSTRTRITFEVGMTQLGGHTIVFGPELKLGRWKVMADMARGLSRLVEGVAIRTFAQEEVEELAGYSTIPVINALSDREHPCQAMTDLLTIRERKGRLEEMKVAFVGDGNNVAQSLMLACPCMGMNLAMANPPGYGPEPDIVDTAVREAGKSGVSLDLLEDPVEAVAGADVVITDVWASIGKEAEEEERRRIFQPYQVNADLVRHARPDYIFLHCLPAFRGQEVTDEIIDSPHSVVWDETENRLHVQKALLAMLMG